MTSEASGGGGFFYKVGHTTARFPIIFSLAGIVLAIVLATGLIDAPFEDDLNNLWIEEGGRVDIERTYSADHTIDGTSYTVELWTTIAKPFGNVLTPDVLLSHRDAALAMTNMTVEIASRPNIKFDMQDVCRTGAAEYVLQCLRVTVLDCFYEGRYDMPTRPAVSEDLDKMAINVVNDDAAFLSVSNIVEDLRPTICPSNYNWGNQISPFFLTGGIDPDTNAYAWAPLNDDFTDLDYIAVLCAIMNGVASPQPGDDPLPQAGFAPWGYLLSGSPALGAPGTNPVYSNGGNGDGTPNSDAFAGPGFTEAGSSPTGTELPFCLKTTLDPSCEVGFTLFELKAVNPNLAVLAVTQLISLGLVFQGDTNIGPTDTVLSDEWVNSRGIAYYGRPSLEGNNPVTGLAVADDAAIVQAAVTDDCFFWDNGAALPPIPRDIILGQEDRSEETFQAIEFVVYAIEPEAMVSKVKSPWRAPALGGPIADLTDDEASEILTKWRTQFVELIPRESTAGSTHNAFSSDSFNDILEDFSSASLPLIVAGYAILIVYAFYTLKRNSSKCDKVLVLSKSVVGGLGVLLVALGVGGGLGLACYLNIPLNATSTQVLPFLLLGLGVDDMFVIAHNIDEDWDTDVPVLIGQLMAVVGPSITLTSFTNCIAFAIGTLTPLPIVIDFAAQASVSILVLYGMNLIVFPAFLALNEFRMRAKRVDCLPCMKREDFEREERGGKEGFLKDVILNQFYIPFLKSIVGKLVVFLVFGVIFALGVYGAVEKVELGLSIVDVAPKGTQEYDFLSVRYAYFSFYDMSIVTKEFDYAPAASQQGMISLFEQVGNTDHVVDDGNMWLQGFLSWGFPDHGLECCQLSGTTGMRNCTTGTLPVYDCVTENTDTEIDGGGYYSSELQDSYLYFLCRFNQVGDLTEAACRGTAGFEEFKAGLEYQALLIQTSTELASNSCPAPYNTTSCATGTNPTRLGCLVQLNLLIAGEPPTDGAVLGACIAAANADGRTIGQGVTEADYLWIVSQLVTFNGALDLTNSNCDPSNPLTNGQCGPVQTELANQQGNAGCTSIFTDAIDGINCDVQCFCVADDGANAEEVLAAVVGDDGECPKCRGSNKSAMCVDFSGSVQCFTMEEDNYPVCLNSFAVESSAASLLGPSWFPDTGVLGGGVSDVEGFPRKVGQCTDVSSEGICLEFSSYSMYSFNLVNNEDYVDLITQVRDVCEASPISSYPTGTGFLYWEQYLSLQETLLNNIIYALLAVFATTLILLLVVPKVERDNLAILFQAAFGGAFILVFVLAQFMVEIYGFMGWFGIKLSALPAVSLIMAVGIGVNFTAHIVLAFILAEGNRNERMEAALDHMFVPIVDATISTLLGVVMLAASEFEFIIKYYFLVYLIIVVLGALNGLILLPAVLAAVGPPSISLPDAGGVHLTVRRGSLVSPKASNPSSVELRTKEKPHDFV